jgi:glycosyltransferase involved in cell wall biosynthesis
MSDRAIPENYSYRFSVIVPTRDRPDSLAELLRSFAELTYPRDLFEVVLVDDGSAQPLDKLVAPWRERLNLSLLRTRGIGPGPARNFGAAQARGEFFAFTDDDCTVAPDWLGTLAVRLQNAPDYLFAGGIRNGLPRNLYSTVWQVITDASYAYYDPAAGRAHAFASINLALSSARFREVGGFAADWSIAASEDREFCWRWRQRNWPMRLAPEAIVYHRPALDFFGFCRLYFRYGRGSSRYHQRHGVIGGVGGLRPDWRFHWSVFRWPFRRYPFSRALTLVGMLILWQIINAAGFFAETFARALSKR